MAKTLEQIQAELEALKTQFTDFSALSPVSYYTHQYSGEEIDQAVTRALPNGAIDQAVGTLVRPNLLDNWYFGRPVDQRGGYVVPPLGPEHLYSDAECKVLIGDGTIDAYRQVTRVSTGNYTYSIDGGTYYVKAEDVVRGYTGNGYGVDRWRIENGDAVILNDGYITVKFSSFTAYAQGFKQDIPKEIFQNAEYTMSFLTHENALFAQSFVVSTNSATDIQLPCSDFVFSFAWHPEHGENAAIRFFNREKLGVSTNLIAAKLELGPTQTLARQENGVWVLNEVPDYGEQVRRCLRYDYIIGIDGQNCPIGIGTAFSNNGALCDIQLPEYMRANPTVSLSGGGIQIRFSAVQNITATSVLNYGFSGDKVQLYFPGLSGLTPGQSCDLFTQTNSKLEFNSNL